MGLGKVCQGEADALIVAKGSLSLMDKFVFCYSFLPVTCWSGGPSLTRT